jgi:hypothetical protein
VSPQATSGLFIKPRLKEKHVEKVDIAQKFNLFREHWSPKIVGELNDSYVKLAKIKGEFVWHHHENEDESETYG